MNNLREIFAGGSDRERQERRGLAPTPDSIFAEARRQLKTIPVPAPPPPLIDVERIEQSALDDDYDVDVAVGRNAEVGAAGNLVNPIPIITLDVESEDCSYCSDDDNDSNYEDLSDYNTEDNQSDGDGDGDGDGDDDDYRNETDEDVDDNDEIDDGDEILGGDENDESLGAAGAIDDNNDVVIRIESSSDESAYVDKIEALARKMAELDPESDHSSGR